MKGTLLPLFNLHYPILQCLGRTPQVIFSNSLRVLVWTGFDTQAPLRRRHPHHDVQLVVVLPSFIEKVKPGLVGCWPPENANLNGRQTPCFFPQKEGLRMPLPAPSKGCQLNPKGWWIGTPLKVLVPGHSLWPLWDCKKVNRNQRLYVRPPTIGDKVWSRLESPFCVYFFSESWIPWGPFLHLLPKFLGLQHGLKFVDPASRKTPRNWHFKNFPQTPEDASGYITKYHSPKT